MQQKDLMFPELDWIGVLRKVLDQVEEERRAFQEMERRREREKETLEAEEKNETDSDTKLLTTKELSQFLRVPKSWIYDRTYRNEIPHYKLGNHLRFDLNRIQEWLVEHRNE